MSLPFELVDILPLELADLLPEGGPSEPDDIFVGVLVRLAGFLSFDSLGVISLSRSDSSDDSVSLPSLSGQYCGHCWG